MRGKRSSILLYFDNYHRVAGLPDEQLGLLFRALMESGGQDGITGFESRYPAMSEKTQMAFLFMADTIRRDAAAYAEKCANYQNAARRRAERSRAEPAPAAAPPKPGPEEEIVPAPAAIRRQLEALIREGRG